MALAMKEFNIEFGAAAGSQQSKTQTVSFAKKVLRAQAVLKGFNIKFTGGNREFKEMLVDIDHQAPVGDNIEVSAQILLRDSSGNIDDAFQGTVQGVVIAETV